MQVGLAVGGTCVASKVESPMYSHILSSLGSQVCSARGSFSSFRAQGGQASILPIKPEAQKFTLISQRILPGVGRKHQTGVRRLRFYSQDCTLQRAGTKRRIHMLALWVTQGRLISQSHFSHL